MNPMLLQKQLRENNSLLQDYVKDLQNWGQEMNKDTFLQKQQEPTTSCKVRKTDKPERKKSTDKPEKKKSKIKKPAAKTGVTDYAAWDKFDVDAELNKLEDDETEDSELTDECSESVHDEAIVEKEKGNKYVKSQNWDQAIKCYTKAIECYSYDPIFFANRALCYLKKSNFEEAEKDCTLSLKLDCTYVKAYQRRAAARDALNKWDHAEYDLLKVLELEPNNEESRILLGNLRTKMGKVDKPPEQRPISKFTASRNKVNKPNAVQAILSENIKSDLPEAKKNIDTSKPASIWPEEDNILVVKPVNKPPHLRSTKPLKRIAITEIDGTKSEKTKECEVATEPEAIKTRVFEKHEKLENIIDDTPKIVSAFRKKKTEILTDTEPSSALPKPNVQSACLKSDDFKVIEKKIPENLTDVVSVSKEIKNTSNLNISSGETRTSQNVDMDLVVPKSSVQFYSTWKNLRSSEDRYRYLKMIEPKDLPRIFLNSLESNIFSNILDILAKHFVENKDAVYSILDNFTQVKRFGTFTMFMSSTDKNNLLKLLDYIKEREGTTTEDLDRLKQKYEL